MDAQDTFIFSIQTVHARRTRVTYGCDGEVGEVRGAAGGGEAAERQLVQPVVRPVLATLVPVHAPCAPRVLPPNSHQYMWHVYLAYTSTLLCSLSNRN